MTCRDHPACVPGQCRGLRRLAPGALLMLAVVGAASAPCAASGCTVATAGATVRPGKPLVETIARMVGAGRGEQIRLAMPGSGLGMTRGKDLELCLDPPVARQQETPL